MAQNPVDAAKTKGPPPLRIAFVPGVTPGKWSRIWGQRVPRTRLEVAAVPEHDQLAVLHDGRADASFVRLPVDREGISLIPLYSEIPVVVVPTDHAVAAFDEVSVDDLADEHRVDVPSMTPKEAIELVATGAGIVIVPKSVARLYDRKDVTHRPVTGVAETQIGLAWLTEATDARIEMFIGIVRGRTERSSRAGDAPVPEKKVPEKKVPKSGQRKPAQRPVGKRGARGGRRGGGR